MKFVNSVGLTTPERMYAIGEMLKANFTWFMESTGIPPLSASYTFLKAEGEMALIDEIVVNQTVLFYSTDNGSYYISSISRIEDGIVYFTTWQPIRGVKGEQGTNGTSCLVVNQVLNRGDVPTSGMTQSILKRMISGNAVLNDFAISLVKNASTGLTYIVYGQLIEDLDTLWKYKYITVSDKINGDKGDKGDPGETPKLYIHCITMKSKIGDAIYTLTVIDKSSIAFTYTSLVQFFVSLGLTSNLAYYECSGAKGSSSGIAIGLFVSSSNILQVKYVMPSSSFNYNTANISESDINFYDMVKEL